MTSFRRQLLLGVIVVTLCGGCAGVSPTQAGQTAGTIAGAAVAPGVGAPLGAFVGMLAGMIMQGHADKVTETRERKELGQQLTSGPRTPAQPLVEALPGQPTRVWVDETVRDGRLIAGHFDVRHIP